MARFADETTADDEHERTLAVADAAVAQIRKLRLPVTPRNYEIFYAYATGHYPTLKLIINDLLARRVVVSDADIDQIGTRFVSQSDIKDRVCALGSRVESEIRQVEGAIDSTISLATSCSRDIAQVDDTLTSIKSRDALYPVVDEMTRIANRIKEGQSKLSAEISTSNSRIDQLRMETHKAVAASLADPLTGLTHWKLLQRSLQNELAVALESGKPFSLVLADIDHFERFNNNWGSEIGDRVLRLVGQTIKSNANSDDIVARYGSDKFAVVLLDTPLKAAYVLADNIRQIVMSRNMASRATGQDLGRICLSFGVASAQAHDTINSLVGRAEACVNAAKWNGRNQVIDETDPLFVRAQFETAVVA